MKIQNITIFILGIIVGVVLTWIFIDGSSEMVEISDPNLPPIGSQIIQPNEQWQEKYGDIENMELYFNMAVAIQALKNQSAAINNMNERLKVLEDLIKCN